MMRFLIVIVQCIFCLAPVKCAGNKQNVLLILVDDLRPALGCYGDRLAYTPNIDKLAQRSTLFTRAYAQQALCGPSRTSLLTSRSPHHLGLFDVHQYWRSSAGNFSSLPQFFRENGYQTMSIGKVFHPGISSNHSDDQPYSWSKHPFHPPSQIYKDAAVCPSIHGLGLTRSIVCPVEVRMHPGKTLPDLQSIGAARSFLNRYVKNRSIEPFFLAVGFHKPHIPLKFPRKYLKHHAIENFSLPSMRWKPPGQPSVAWNPWSDLRRRDDIESFNISFPWGTMPDRWARHIWQSYYASVTYIDDLVGQLISELITTGLASNTVVLLTSDHGWSLGEHGEWSKYSNYEVSTHVPLLLSIPGGVTQRTDALVELLDVFPTLAELANPGTKVPPCRKGQPQMLCTDGQSLAPLLLVNHTQRSRGIAWRTGAFSQYPRPSSTPTRYPDSDQPQLQDITIMGYSIRTHHHRYTEWVHFDPVTKVPDWTRVVAKELYDHVIDPGENLNLSDREALLTVQSSLSHQVHTKFV